MSKLFRLAVVDKFGYFKGLVSVTTNNEKIARRQLLKKAKGYGESYGGVFYG